MKPHILQVATAPNRSFSIRKDFVANINSRWHCHAHVEIVCFHKGSGTQFVGDDIRRFNAGDVVLVGANLPHYWHFDPETDSREESLKIPFCTVLHFTESFWGDRFLHLEENTVLRNTLEKAKRGIALKGQVALKIIDLLEKLHDAEGPYRIMILIECLVLSGTCDKDLLASLGFQYNNPDHENERINLIYKYVLNNFSEKIRLETVASIASLSPNSFCRYFKSHTGKQFSQFLNEIRIGYACKMLIKNSVPIKQICYESGFHNFSCFYKQFKHVTGKTPAGYQQAYLSR